MCTNTVADASSLNQPQQVIHEEASDNCEVEPNELVQIKLQMATSHEDRYNEKNILRGDISDIEQYLTEGNKFACEELYSTDYEKHIYDQHIRFFMDLDKVPQAYLRLDVIKQFIGLFVDTLYTIIDEFPNIQISNQYKSEIIAQGARIAIKSATDKQPGGVHIYFTSIITHPSSFPQFRRIIDRVKAKAAILLDSTRKKAALRLFSHIDSALYNSLPSLRCIYALKDRISPCGVIRCQRYPCEHVTSHIYIPLEAYPFSDYFFTYVGEECYEAMHIEICRQPDKTATEANEVYVPKDDPRNNKLSMYSTLINLINDVDYSKYITVGMCLYNKSDGLQELLQLYKAWSVAKYKDKSGQIEHNWNNYWPSRTVERKVGLGTLKRLAEESNPNGFKNWCATFTWSGIKKLLYNFTHTDVSEYYFKVKPIDYIFNSTDRTWHLFNSTTKLWEQTKLVDRLLNDISDYFKSELGKLNASYLSLQESEKTKAIIERIKVAINQISKCQFKEKVITELRGRYTNNDMQFNQQKDVINFKDCTLSLRTGVTRERVQEDYCTKCLPYDFSHITSAPVRVQEVKQIILDIVGENIEEVLSWLGYCMTGETTKHNLLFLQGLTAANGKTTMAKIFKSCLPIYCFNLSNETFYKKYQYFHKQAANLEAPVRFAYIEELNREELDTTIIKEFCDGKLGGVNVLYKDAKEMNLQCKLYITTNHMPKFKPDAGIQRRGLALELTKRFLPEDEYNLAKDQGETNIAIANSYLLDLFDDVDYKLAFIRLLLPYAQKFYSSTLLLPNMRSNFVDWCIDSDKWIQFKLQHLELTNDPNDRLTKQDLADAFASTMKIQVSELTALSEGKRIGLRYEKGLRMNSRTTRSYAGMRSERGVFAGVRVITAANTLTPTIVD